MATATVVNPCPLCGNEIYIAKMLYGFPVCAKCHQDFAIKRAIAHFLDNMIFQLVLTVVFFIFFFAGGIFAATIFHDNEESGVRAIILIFVIGLILILTIILAKDGFHGHSPAKYMLGMQVIDSYSGRPINFGDSIQRNLPLIVPFVPIVVLIQLFTGEGIRLGDGWAQTKVILKQFRDQDPFLPRQALNERSKARIAAQHS